MGVNYSITEKHLPEELREQAEAAEKDPVELFEDRVTAIAEWAEEIPTNNEGKAIVYAVLEVYRTVDGVGEDAGTLTDSTDIEKTPRGAFDLRQKTKDSGGDNDDSRSVTDSSDGKRTEGGEFDLRKRTKTDD